MAVAAETWTGSEEGVDVILARAASGDDDAVAYLYRRYVPALVHYAQRRGAVDSEGAADLAFLDAVNALPAMRSWSESVFRAYAYRATRSRVSGDHRRNTVDTVMLDDELDIAAPGSIEDAIISQRGFDELLDGLSPGQRDVIVHRFLGGFSVAETAARLGRTPGAVKQLQFQGLTRLRATFLVAVVLILVAGGVVLMQTSESIVTDLPTGVDDGPDSGVPDVENLERQTEDEEQSVRKPFAVELVGVEGERQDALSPTTTISPALKGPQTTDLSPEPSDPPVTTDEAAAGESGATRVADAATGDLQVGSVSADAVVDFKASETDGQSDKPVVKKPAPTSSTTSTPLTSTTSTTIGTGQSRTFPAPVLLFNERLERCAAIGGDGVDLVNQACRVVPSQIFDIIDLGRGAFRIVSVTDGSCAERGGDEHTSEQYNVYLAPCDGSSGQRWRIDLAQEGTYHIKSTSTGYCLDPDGPNSEITENLAVRVCDETSSQRWSLTHPS